MARSNTSKTPSNVKVGDAVEIPNVPAAMVRLPDGSVVTCRGTYTARHAGEHAIVVSKDGKFTETKFTVTDPKAKKEADE